jgi:type VI secretion system secreted protein VgrG
MNDNLTVEGNQTESIKGNHSQQTDASLHIKIKDKHIIETGTDVTLKAGTKVVIEAGAEMLLSAGGSTVKIDAAGVSMSGAAINLNSGGGAGSGAAYAGELAELPKFLELAEVIDPTMIALEKGTAVAGEANVQEVAFEAVEVEYPELVQSGALVTELCNCGEGGTCPIHKS